MSRFEPFIYDEIALQDLETINELFEALMEIMEDLPQSRIRSIALTQIEEAQMWAEKAIQDRQIKRILNRKLPNETL